MFQDGPGWTGQGPSGRTQPARPWEMHFNPLNAAHLGAAAHSSADSRRAQMALPGGQGCGCVMRAAAPRGGGDPAGANSRLLRQGDRGPWARAPCPGSLNRWDPTRVNLNFSLLPSLAPTYVDSSLSGSQGGRYTCFPRL